MNYITEIKGFNDLLLRERVFLGTDCALVRSHAYRQ